MELGEYKVLVMRLESKPWQMGDNSGVSSSIRFMANGIVFKAKISEDLFAKYKDLVQVEKRIVLSASSFNEVTKLAVSAIK